MSRSLIQRYLWVLLLCFALTSTNIFAQENKIHQTEEQPQVLLPPKIVSPELASIRRPAHKYQLNEVIEYQVQVKWPEPVSDVRMSSPQMTLENLELTGIGQETVSKPGQDNGEEQILTLGFKAQNPGPAKINSLVLEWTQAEGAATSSLKIPSVEITIRKQTNYLFWILIFGFSLVVFGAGFIFSRMKKKTPEASGPAQTFEETCLSQLVHAKNLAETSLHNANFLNDLTQILDRYVQQKFVWNRSQEDYNALQKKADKIWGKKEIRELKELFEKIEYYRFSGSELKPDELITLFQSVRSFIERKKVI